MVSSDMAQAISPCFTPYDRDAIFVISLYNIRNKIMDVGILAAESTRRSILNAVANF